LGLVDDRKPRKGVGGGTQKAKRLIVLLVWNPTKTISLASTFYIKVEENYVYHTKSGDKLH
jgi:hypothetical protein